MNCQPIKDILMHTVTTRNNRFSKNIIRRVTRPGLSWFTLKQDVKSDNELQASTSQAPIRHAEFSLKDRKHCQSMYYKTRDIIIIIIINNNNNNNQKQQQQQQQYYYTVSPYVFSHCTFPYWLILYKVWFRYSS